LTEGSRNALRWDGAPGHYEVYYLTLTDPRSGVGAWIRYTMLAPLTGAGTCSLWFLIMDPAAGPTARKQTFPVTELHCEAEPFRLRLGGATLEDQAAQGGLEDAEWTLRWDRGRGYDPVRPALRRFATTILTLPHGDIALSGTIRVGDRELELDGARGGQAHLWGRAHAESWAWARCGDFRDLDGKPVADTFLDGVSVRVRRFGREVGPATPIVGRIAGEDFHSTSPVKLLANNSAFGLMRWRFESVGGARKIVGEVDADPKLLAGVTYHDPDGRPAYCYNTEVASMRLHLYRRSKPGPGWRYEQTLDGAGRAHFEYAQREPVSGVELLLR
jgi:hypothetical protein